MILTGSLIEKECLAGRITIDPFNSSSIQPNSYDFELGSTIVVYKDRVLDARLNNAIEKIEMDESGLTLYPGQIYLGHTKEIMGSKQYVPIIRARSSVARLGLFVHVTADLIDIGSINQWTLQLNPVQPVRVYPGMRIGQVTFWTVKGAINLYQGKYQNSRGPQASRAYLDF